MVTFTEEILNAKLYYFFAVAHSMTNIPLQRLIFGNTSFLHRLIFTDFTRENPSKNFCQNHFLGSNLTELTKNIKSSILKQCSCTLYQMYTHRVG